MIFKKTEIPGVVLIEMEPIQDERGFFARTWCEEEFRKQGLRDDLVQCSISYNRHRGTLRGMHYQQAPHEEAKIVRVVRGTLYDVVLDLRQGSVTYGKWQAFELDARARQSLYIPEGVAHGFQTLEDDTEVMYFMSSPYHAASGRTILWNDPAFGIQWPIADPTLSEKDRRLV